MLLDLFPSCNLQVDFRNKPHMIGTLPCIELCQV